MSLLFVSRILGMIVTSCWRRIFWGLSGAPGGWECGIVGRGLWIGWRLYRVLVLTPILVVVQPINALTVTRLAQASARTLFAGALGLILSLIIAGLLAFPLSLLPEPFSQILPIALAVIVAYLRSGCVHCAPGRYFWRP